MALIPTLALQPAGYGLIILIIFSVVCASLIKSRMKLKGCMTTGYTALVIFCISLLGFGVLYMLAASVKNNVSTFINGEQYTASVTSYTSEEKEDDEGDMRTYYTSHITFTTKEGNEITRKKSFSSTGMPVIGETYTIYYDAKNNTLFIWEAMVLILFFGMIIMGSVLLFAFIGLMLFAFGGKMDGYWNVCKKIGSVFFLPLIMIAFDALLIYALLHKEHPTFVVIILSFFILALTLAIWGYLKMTIQKDPLKWKRSSTNSWSGNWDEENEKDSEHENFRENNNTGKFVRKGRVNKKRDKKKR